MSIRILISDDHGILRDGLHALLSVEPGYEVVGEATDGEEAVRLTAALQPDLVLMDVSMPAVNGFEATRQIAKLSPETKVLILTVHEDKGFLQEALRSGASGYILKRALKTDLFNAIRTVMGGGIYLHPAVMHALAQTEEEGNQPVHSRLSELTQREIEVLKLLAEGYTNMEIAERLVISARTVQFHRGNLTEKLNLHSRVELFHFAVENGLIEYNGGR